MSETSLARRSDGSATLLPTVVGALLGFGGSLFLRRSEGDWQRSQDSFAREMQVVKPLDDALVEAQRRISGYDVAEGQSKWQPAHQQ